MSSGLGQRVLVGALAVARSPWFRLAASLLLIGFLLYKVPFRFSQVVLTLGQADLALVGVAVVVKVAPVFLSARRQQLVFLTGNVQMPLGKLFRLLMIGEALNRFTPGNLGALAYLTLHAGGKAHAMGLVLVDKVLYLLCISSVAAGAAFYVGADLLAGVLLIGVTAALVLLTGAGHLLARFSPTAKLQAWMAELVKALTRRPGLCVHYLGSVALGLITAVLAFWLVLRSVGVTVGAGVAFACVTLTTVAVAAPVTVGGVGLREWVFLAFLKDEIPADGFIGYMLLVYLVGSANAILGALVAIVAPVKEQVP